MQCLRLRLVPGAVVALAVAVLAVPSAAELVLSGRVIGISDGDTLTVLRQPPTVLETRATSAASTLPRAARTTALERKHRLSELAFGKTVRVEVEDIGLYGRLVARVKVLPVGLGWRARLVLDQSTFDSASIIPTLLR